MPNKIVQFFKLETSGAILLMAATLIALLISNSPFYPLYKTILTTPISIKIGNTGLDKPILLWINDGLMAIFFCLVAIEIKRKVFANPELGWSKLSFPIFGALGGIVVPASIFLFITKGHPEYTRGWAIPTATDIAFALGILLLLGKRVPDTLKLFLVMLAVLDDLAAILVIALFYTSKLSIMSLLLASVGCLILFLMNRYKVTYIIAYIWVGIFLWVCMVKSGVHATLTGVILGFALPMGIKDAKNISPSMLMEHELKYWVNYMHLPIFAFANAGVPLTGISIDAITEPLPLAIALGLFLGKPLGVVSFVWGAIQMKWITLPHDITWLQFFAVAILTGIGFTMSLFIGTLAFEESLIMRIRIGVLLGTLLAATTGYLLLRYATSHNATNQ